MRSVFFIIWAFDLNDWAQVNSDVQERRAWNPAKDSYAVGKAVAYYCSGEVYCYIVPDGIAGPSLGNGSLPESFLCVVPDFPQEDWAECFGARGCCP